MSSSLNCGVAGASAGGTLTELIATGAMDAYLIKNPNVTFFRFRYNKHTNFALEAITQSFQSQVAFGSDSQITLNRTGDLVYFMYIDMLIPGLRATQTTNAGSNMPFVEGSACDPCGDAVDAHCAPLMSGIGDFPDASTDNYPDEPKPWAHWANAIGQLIVKRASLVIGGQIIDTLYSDYLYMWEELSGKPGKRLMEMVGKSHTRAQLVDDSAKARRLYVPLPFFFTHTSGNALPLVSLQFHGVQIHVEFEQLEKLVVTSKPDQGTNIKVEAVTGDNGTSELNANSLKACLDTTYIYLDIEERDRFATGSFEQLITQVQQHSVITNTEQVRMPLNFNHPIQELIFGVKRQCNTDANAHFNYSGKNNEDPINQVCLRLNNLPRFSNRPASWFRLVQPYQHHTNIPKQHIYCYSFALHPEEPQPSGSCNFSRIDHVDLVLELQKDITQDGKNVQVLVFARNLNLMRYRDGLGGAGFSN